MMRAFRNDDASKTGHECGLAWRGTRGDRYRVPLSTARAASSAEQSISLGAREDE
jgi:hypothetical protein